MRNTRRYVRLSDGSVRRKDTPPHPRLSVVDPDYRVPAVEHPPLDLDFTRKHRDELRAGVSGS